MTIQDAIAKYIENFDQCWEEEKYKWVAVRHYKQHWDINEKRLSNDVGESLRCCIESAEWGYVLSI